jgi:hypothetical protein
MCTEQKITIGNETADKIDGFLIPVMRFPYRANMFIISPCLFCNFLCFQKMLRFKYLSNKIYMIQDLLETVVKID